MKPRESQERWFDDYSEKEDEDIQIEEYDITASPNDFNIMTIFNFIESGVVQLPEFQRNYVWDINRASMLIESLILGLPVPQLFLYEEGRNKFQIIDGQQRLLSIYYFKKKRFPRKERRSSLRKIYDQEGKIPSDILEDDTYFRKFVLNLPERKRGSPNKFQGLNYDTLGEYQNQFDLRPLRNVIVKQNVPKDDDSSIYEIFKRLNSGGVNLKPQEIRASMYHSDFYNLLSKLNIKDGWRNILNSPEPDLHRKDMEIILKSFALLLDDYKPPMSKFLNDFSRKAKSHNNEQNEYLERLFDSFIDACKNLPKDAFVNKKNKRFNVALFEAVFVAVCSEPSLNRSTLSGNICKDSISALEKNQDFLNASHEGTTKTVNVNMRFSKAKELIKLEK